jgi:hypothetical protein
MPAKIQLKRNKGGVNGEESVKERLNERNLTV